MENLGYSKFIVGLATFFPIPLPLPRAATDFKACFKTYLHKADTAALIDELSALKLNVVQLCLDNNVSFEAKLPVVDAYLAALWRLQDSLLATGGIVKADRELAFDWRLYVSGHAEAFRSNEVLFEIIMIMHTKALFHFHVAKNLLESDSVAFLSEAGKHMLSAASAMDYLQQQISSTKWLRKFNYAAQNPPETSASVCQGLAGFFKMCAASLAVVKAVSSSSVFSAAEPSAPAKGPSALVKARLCMAVVNHARSSVDFLSNSNTTGGKLSLWINERLMHHIAATRELYSSVTKYYLAQSNYEKSEVGLCIGFCQNAKLHMVQQRSFDVSQHGLPSFTNSFVYLGETVTFLSSKLDELQNLADKDNRFVHFQVIPNASSLPALPEAANVMNAQPFVEPKSESLVPFTIPEKASLLGSIFGFKPSTSTSTSVATTAPPASTTTITASQTQDPSNAPVMQATTNMMAVPPMAPFAYGSQVMSDEQFARELQAKMNLEAVANAPPPPPRQG